MCCILFNVQFRTWPNYHTATFGRQVAQHFGGPQHFYSTLVLQYAVQKMLPTQWLRGRHSTTALLFPS
jgi:hypothetical protein